VERRLLATHALDQVHFTGLEKDVLALRIYLDPAVCHAPNIMIQKVS